MGDSPEKIFFDKQAKKLEKKLTPAELQTARERAEMEFQIITRFTILRQELSKKWKKEEIIEAQQSIGSHLSTTTFSRDPAIRINQLQESIKAEPTTCIE